MNQSEQDDSQAAYEHEQQLLRQQEVERCTKTLRRALQDFWLGQIYDELGHRP